MKPDEALAIGAAPSSRPASTRIEVPLNSPDPFRSIELLAKSLPKAALVGAGTVLTAAQVDDLHNAGGKLLVSPNIDSGVTERADHHGMVTMPRRVHADRGVFGAVARRIGAEILPASALGTKGISAIKAVLPKETIVGAVGGVSEKDFADYAKIGVSTFGLGSSLYTPGLSVEVVAGRAVAAVTRMGCRLRRR